MRVARRFARASMLAAGALALAAMLAACGGSSGGSGGGDASGTATPTATRAADTLGGETPAVTLELQMRDIAYGAEELRAPAGAVFAIEFENRGVLEHDFAIETFPGEASEIGRGDPEYDVRVLLKRGESATLLLRVAQPGTIEFWCTVAGHREVGMEGVLVIE